MILDSARWRSIPVADESKMNNDEAMTSNLQAWLSEQIPGYSHASAATKTGLAVSTVRRHLLEPTVAETVIQICRAYELNPVEALVQAGILELEEVYDFAETEEFSEELSDLESHVIIDRMHEQLDELQERLRPKPLPGQLDMMDLLSSTAGEKDPDYSEMSEQDAIHYGLAADRGEENIGHDELPHEP